jgi:hypothetical protein
LTHWVNELAEGRTTRAQLQERLLASDEARFCSGSEFTMDGASTAGMNGV